MTNAQRGRGMPDTQDRPMALHQGRTSRRRLILAAAGGAGVAMAGIACSTGPKTAGSGNPGGSSQAKQPKRGGVLNYAGGAAGSNDTRGRTFDPTIQTQWASKAYTLFYERLLSYDLRTYKVGPELAQKWEQPSQTEYLFSLQPGVKWHSKAPANGRALTADDIVWSLDRARTDDPKFYSRSLLTLVDKIEAPDKSTIRITTKGPWASTLKALAVDNLAILCREVIEKFPKPITAESAVGTGAFMMSSEEDNVGAEYVRNPGYWRQGLPYLDSVRTRHFPDYQTAYAAFLANQVDITLIPGEESKKYVTQQGAGYTPAWYPDDTFRFMYPNTQRKPMDDPRVTRALKLLVDHDEFNTAWAESHFGKGGYGSIFPTALMDWDLTTDEYRRQLEWKQPKDEAAKEAISLLNAAGFNKDNPLKFTLDGDTSEGAQPENELLQAQWKKWSQGIVIADLKVNQGATGDAIRAQRTFTYICTGQSTGLVDPDIWLTNIYRTGGSLNFMGFGDAKADAMVDKQRAIFDESQRKAAVKEIVLYLIDKAPSGIPANRYFLQAVKPKVLNQAPEYFLNGVQYQNVWLAG
ncbi:MAG TPA: ABC transporter substrate-binding protein [Dehalococcoidia bacterium]|nr:ABC transporter substrate-binding protein [Dehalococcoidia bacterium]